VNPTFQAALTSSFDICIVGSGPAGIITALELEKLAPKTKILLLEYGTGKTAKQSNSLDDSIENINPRNHHDPYECTNKGLGGTSATWGGRCVMYDEVDFFLREPTGANNTWPREILREIQKSSEPANSYFDCGRGGFNLHEFPQMGYRPIADGFIEGDVTDSGIEKWSLPTRFGKKYRNRLVRSPTIHFVEGCEVQRLDGVGTDGKVRSIIVRNIHTRDEYRIQARIFIIAAGAQETTRILLKSTEVFRQLGGVPDSLGKFYQGHISGKIANIKFSGDPAKTDYGFGILPSGEYVRRRFLLSTETLVKKGLLNTAFWLDNPFYVDPKHRNGAMSLMYLAMITPILGKRLAPPAVAYSITKGRVNRLGAHLLNVLRDFPRSILVPMEIFCKRYIPKRKLPGVFLFNKDNRYALHFHAEQMPARRNRMELGSDGNTLVIHYEISDGDIQSVIGAHEVLDEWLRKCSCGYLEYWHPSGQLGDIIRNSSKDGVHQVGTTRISEREEDGVVDKDLKVWRIDNLYICSSSTFPTSGQANPTFMMGAFAVRLAGHLVKKHALY
jgi:hypothetical protein